MGPIISEGTFCFELQVEICGPADYIFRGTEYYVPVQPRVPVRIIAIDNLVLRYKRMQDPFQPS